MDLGLVLQIIVSIFAIIGGIYSLIQIIKNKKDKLVITSNNGVFWVVNIQPSNYMHIVSKITFFNPKNETVAITDAIGTIKYKNGKKCTEKIINLKSNILPITLNPKEAKVSELKFIFRDVELDKLATFGLAHFFGFLEDVPTYIVDERENENNIDKPIQFYITFHINSKDTETIHIALLEMNKENMKRMTGTLTNTEITRIEHRI